MGFTDVENLSEPIMYQSQRYGFGEGWVAAVNVMDIPEESPFRIPE